MIVNPVQKNSMIMTSTDGDSWTLRSVGPLYYFRGIAYGRDTFVAVGNAILQSDPLYSGKETDRSKPPDN
jgi:hypothetical protein